MAPARLVEYTVRRFNTASRVARARAARVPWNGARAWRVRTCVHYAALKRRNARSTTSPCNC
eukprot:7742452-Lingulodinium_polyedra.AAC.1